MRGGPGRVRLAPWGGAAVAGLTLAVFLAVGFRSGDEGVDTEPGAHLVELTAHRGWWEVRYLAESPHLMVQTANELHLAVDEPVLLRIDSKEPMRNFRIRNLSGRVAVSPQRKSDLSLRARQPGSYRGGCTRFCSERQARMQLTVVVHEPAGFAAWLESQRGPAPPPRDTLARLGHDVFMTGTCATCHRIRGTPAMATFGPDLTRIGSRRTLGAGAIPNNRAHLAAWLVDPHNFKPGSLMPPTHLTPEALHALVYYMELLR
jgi:cytochrome c oxidase subunit II